jgi:hypothetical protein
VVTDGVVGVGLEVSVTTGSVVVGCGVSMLGVDEPVDVVGMLLLDEPSGRGATTPSSAKLA